MATALSDGNSSLNNELNVNLDYNFIVQELKGNGIYLNKTLSKPYKQIEHASNRHKKFVKIVIQDIRDISNSMGYMHHFIATLRP